MRKPLLLFWLTAAAVVLSASAAAQATLETLMTHSVSTAVGTHAGTTLGHATNTFADRVAGQTASVPSRSYAPPHQVARGRRAGALNTSAAHRFTPPASQGSGGSLIASIQGGEKSTPSVCSSNAGDAKTANQNCATAATAPDSHPAVVNLPAAK